MKTTRASLPADSRVRFRVVLLGLPLVAANVYWISSTWSGATTQVSLFLNVVFLIFALTLLNTVLSRLSRRLALSSAELIVLYIMLTVGTAATGHDTVEMLTQVVGYPFWFASPENDWEALFFSHLPRWLMVEEKSVLEGFYTAGESFYERRVFVTWIQPLMLWASFLVALYFCMMCINILFHRQWMERERLSFPIVRVPLGIVDPKLSIARNQRFWYGFIGAACLSLMNGLHRLYPVVPGLTYGKFDFSAMLTERPWNAAEGIYIEFLPFVLGISFFIPVDLSFSIWFFYGFWKLEAVLGSAVGVHYLPGFPGYGPQGTGAVLLMFGMFVYWARHHLWEVAKAIFTPLSSAYREESRLYTFALLGWIGSFGFLVGFCFYAGMAIWVALVFLGLFYIVSTVLTRARAELGPPTHDFPFTPTAAMTNVIGTKRIDGSSLTQFAMFKFVDYGNRSSVMPHTLEALYLKGKFGIPQAWIVVTAMVLALILGASVGLIGNVARGYEDTGQTWVGRGFPTLASWLQYPSGTDHVYILYGLAGAAITTVLAMLNRVFVWWPFHPLGYILGGEWMLRYFWFSIFLAWALKWLILRFGGLDAHRKAVPFFIGITVGDATMIALWSIYGTVWNVWTLGLLYW